MENVIKNMETFERIYLDFYYDVYYGIFLDNIKTEMKARGGKIIVDVDYNTRSMTLDNGETLYFRECV